MLRHGFQGRRRLMIDALIDPHIPEDRGHVIAGFPIRDALDVKQWVAAIAHDEVVLAEIESAASAAFVELLEEESGER